jgi:DNA-binding CsgD family transcriptional regulator
LATCEAFGNRDDLAAERVRVELTNGRHAPHIRAAISGSAELVIALVHDDLGEALDRIEQTRRLLPDDGIVVQPLFLGMFHALAAVVVAASGVGELREGRDWVDIDDVFMSSSFAVARAIVAGRDGDRAAAETLFCQGDAGLAGAPWVQALFRLLAGKAARSDGWGEPDVLLTNAAAFFASAGNEKLAASYLPLSGAADDATPGWTQSTSFGLTSREADVLALLCTGQTNQQIAANLHLSPRTVEKHVERMLAKTRAANRTELASIALRTSEATGPGRPIGRPSTG